MACERITRDKSDKSGSCEGSVVQKDSQCNSNHQTGGQDENTGKYSKKKTDDSDEDIIKCSDRKKDDSRYRFKLPGRLKLKRDRVATKSDMVKTQSSQDIDTSHYEKDKQDKNPKRKHLLNFNGFKRSRSETNLSKVRRPGSSLLCCGAGRSSPDPEVIEEVIMCPCHRAVSSPIGIVGQKCSNQHPNCGGPRDDLFSEQQVEYLRNCLREALPELTLPDSNRACRKSSYRTENREDANSTSSRDSELSCSGKLVKAVEGDIQDRNTTEDTVSNARKHISLCQTLSAFHSLRSSVQSSLRSSVLSYHSTLLDLSEDRPEVVVHSECSCLADDWKIVAAVESSRNSLDSENAVVSQNNSNALQRCDVTAKVEIIEHTVDNVAESKHEDAGDKKENSSSDDDTRPMTSVPDKTLFIEQRKHQARSKSCRSHRDRSPRTLHSLSVDDTPPSKLDFAKIRTELLESKSVLPLQRTASYKRPMSLVMSTDTPETKLQKYKEAVREFQASVGYHSSPQGTPISPLVLPSSSSTTGLVQHSGSIGGGGLFLPVDRDRSHEALSRAHTPSPPRFDHAFVPHRSYSMSYSTKANWRQNNPPSPRKMSQNFTPSLRNISQSVLPLPRNTSQNIPPSPRNTSQNMPPSPRNTSQNMGPNPRNVSQIIPPSPRSTSQNMGPSPRNFSPLIFNFSNKENSPRSSPNDDSSSPLMESKSLPTSPNSTKNFLDRAEIMSRVSSQKSSQKSQKVKVQRTGSEDFDAGSESQSLIQLVMKRSISRKKCVYLTVKGDVVTARQKV